jgi:hypothetical protein
MDKKKLSKIFTKIRIITSFIVLNILLLPCNIYAQNNSNVPKTNWAATNNSNNIQTQTQSNNPKTNWSTNNQNNDLEVDWFNILPELSETAIDDANNAIYKVWYEWGHVRENYNDIADKIWTSEQIASWIMNRDTIMNYLVFIVKFLSQLWLFVWFGFIIYAGYTYMLSIFNWNQAKFGTVKNAIIWIIIVIFSYAIMKTLTSIIGIS